MEWTEENRRIEARQTTLWENKLADWHLAPMEIQMEELLLGLRNMGHRQQIEGHSQAVDRVYFELQDALIAIPGHARSIAESIEREREQVKDVPFNLGPRIGYDRKRLSAFETLAHLPSPETVKVLGDYLADERDLHELTHEQTKGQSCITGGSSGNSSYSAKALQTSGLRDKPSREGIEYDYEIAKAAWREWWEEVKAGRKTFSFKGQSVEYRFRPDGTWETLAMVNAPDDGPKLAGRVERPGVGKAEPGAGEIPRGWVWLVFPVILAAVFGIWFVSRKFGKGL